MNKIAIIEDDIDICNMIAKFLENNKYIVHYALNGAEGIELCKSLVPDLIILDIPHWPEHYEVLSYHFWPAYRQNRLSVFVPEDRCIPLGEI